MLFEYEIPEKGRSSREQMILLGSQVDAENLGVVPDGHQTDIRIIEALH